MIKIHNAKKSGEHLSDLKSIRHLIIVEGDDDAAVAAFLAQDIVADVLIFVANGESAIGTSLSLLRDLRDFNGIQSITIIRDANGNPNGKIESTRRIYRTLGFEIPTASFAKSSGKPTTAILTMPPGGFGCLESVLLEAYPSPENRIAAEKFTAEVDGDDPAMAPWTTSQVAKRQLRALLAVGSKKLQIDPNSIVSVAVGRVLWDRESEAFEPYVRYFQSLTDG